MKPHCKPLAASLKPSFLAVHLTFSILHSAFASVPLSWTVTPRNPAPVAFDRHHGETLEFRCQFEGFGELPFDQAADIRLWYQTNGMAAAWWSVPAFVSSNVLMATFPPQADPGADRLALYFGAPSNAYASAVLRLRHSPGFTPNVLPAPESGYTETDPVFSAWLATNDIYTVSPEMVTNIVRGVAPTPGDYAAVSNAAIYTSNRVDRIIDGSEHVGHADYASDASSANNALSAAWADVATVAEELRDPTSFDRRTAAEIFALLNSIPDAAARAVYDVHDLMWDEAESILYWHKIRQGHDEYIAVTNIDLTHPTNAVLLKAWREANQ